MLASYQSCMLVMVVGCLSITCVNAGKFYTPLNRGYEFACVAENLKGSNTYYCDNDGKIRCLPGWTEPHNLCRTPVCTVNNKTCVNGNCTKPFNCDCLVGWMGQLCEKCVPLPGCVHGYCNKSLECICKKGWQGMYCDKPSCTGCKHGRCIMPGMCACHAGWSGPNCTICEPRDDCHYGRCVDQPFECKCYSKYEGGSCEKPVCKKGCHPEHGYCKTPETCYCKPGWRGENCTECIPYWNCKYGRCIDEPWQCVCDKGYVGPDCSSKGHVNGNWGNWGPWGKCSVTCGYGEEKRTRSCNYPKPAGNGTYCSHDGSSHYETRPCKNKPCTGYYEPIYYTTTPPHPGTFWSEWGKWSPCSKTCGSGVRTRNRRCLIGPLCQKGHDKEEETCNKNPCPINGGYSQWGKWSPCTARCEDEVGDEVRRRRCNNPPPSNGGLSCEAQGLGPAREQRFGCKGNTPRQSNDPHGQCFTIGE